MSSVSLKIVGATIALSIASQPIAIKTVGQQGPAGPTIPAGSNGRVLFGDDNLASSSANLTYDKDTSVLTVTGNVAASNYLHHTSGSAALTAAGVQAGSAHKIGFSSLANATGSLDAYLARDAAGTISIRNAAAGLGTLNVQALASSAGSDLLLNPGGTNRWYFAGAGGGHFRPYNTNAYDFGSFTEVVRSGHFGTNLYLAANVTDASNYDAARLYYNSAGSTPGYTLTTTNLGTGVARDLVLTSATGFVRVPGSFVMGQGASNPSMTVKSAWNHTTAAAYIQLGFISGQDSGLSYLTYYSQMFPGTNAGLPYANATSLLANAGQLWLTTGGRDIAFITDNTTPKLRIRHAEAVVSVGAGNTFRVYNTETDASNGGWLQISYSSNICTITTLSNGFGLAGSLRLGAGTGYTTELGAGGTMWWGIPTDGHFGPATPNAQDFGNTTNPARSGYFGTHVQAPRLRTTPLTVATLPVAAAAGNGTTAYVTDATVAYTSANIGSAPTGGGANHVPVRVVNGAWVIG